VTKRPDKLALRIDSKTSDFFQPKKSQLDETARRQQPASPSGLSSGYSVYAATKSAVETLTLIFAKELRGRNITVNAVAPGPTATDLFLTGKTQEQIDHLAKMPPMERLGTPEDIAATVSFLVGPDGGWIDGQTLRANGGIA